METAWWRGAVGYEVYLRSFQDSDGDGVGDLEGVRRRLPYLRDLGVDLVWITPFYPTPGADHGYDVADYAAVDPLFGDLTHLERLVADAHQLGLRVVADIVPNHSSDQHEWFQKALADPDAPERGYYVWRDPAPDGGPPNNWVSHFGGSAWEYDEASGQYYLHLFLPEQPDLNWANDALQAEFDRILERWLELGLDGFRIDVAHAMVHDTEYRDNPLLAEEPPPPDAHPSVVFGAYEHRYDQDQEEVLEIYERWRAIAAAHDAVLIGEVYLLDPDRLGRYVRDQSGLHTAFCFLALRTGWDAAEIHATLAAALDAAAGPYLSWPLSSHDDPRAAERFGGGARGARRALAYTTLLAGLPGTLFLFQGDELGLDNGVVPPESAADPVTVRNAGQRGRDGSRTPMLWDRSDGFGFTTGRRPWLPFGTNRSPEQSVAAQRGRPGSHLERVRTLLHTRRGLGDLTGAAPLAWLDAPTDVVAYRRGRTVVACNTGAATVVRLGAAGSVRFSSSGEDRAAGASLHLAADSAAVVELDDGAVSG